MDNPINPTSSNRHRGYFALLTSLFFMWGFLTAMNDVLVPYFRKALNLSYLESNLVQMAFFLAYSIGGLVYFLISTTKGDPLARLGYKWGIVLGLLVSAVGALMFYPAAQMISYPLFLAALFVLALGFTLLQISANPYVAALGPESSASSRLNLSQGFNSLGTTLAPIIGAFLLFNYFGDSPGVSATSVPYLIFGCILLLGALIFFLIRLPNPVTETEQPLEKRPVALRFPQLRYGMLAIFCYVGAEVAVGTMLINFLGLPETLGIQEEAASIYVALYWGGLMVGRFLGAISLSTKVPPARRLWLMAMTALACLGVIMGAIFLNEYLLEPFVSGTFHRSDFTWDGYFLRVWTQFNVLQYWPYFLLVLCNILAFHLGQFLPARTLMIFAAIAFILLLGGIFGRGEFAVWTTVGVGLFNSIMWSNIFTMAIEGLGKYKSQGSSLLVTMIIGGAILPPLQGAMADRTGDIPWSFVVPALAYIYLIWYGMAWPKMVRQHPPKDNSKS